jgi:hypothetical protein
MRAIRFLAACLLAVCLAHGSPLRADSYENELYRILEETKSPDAFMLTLRCLDDDRSDPRELIPVAIRNAERLGILADHAGKDGRKVDRAATFAELLERIHKRMTEATPKAEDFNDAYPTPTIIPKVMLQNPARPSQGQTIEATPEVEAAPADRTPSIPPVFEESPDCDEPPDEAVILKELPPLPRRLPFCDVCRDDVQVVTELIGYEPRHAAGGFRCEPGRCLVWKCTVFYTETVQSRFPFPFCCSRPRSEVVYVEQPERASQAERLHGCTQR